VMGNEIRGTFTLKLRGHETEPIEYNAADSTVKRRLEELPNVGTVTVLREQTSAEKTYRWSVTFDSNPGLFPAGTGDVSELEYDASGLTSTNGLSGLQSDGITVTTTTQGSEPIKGTFALGFDSSDSCRTQQSLCSYTYTAPIRNDASASEVKYALQELEEIGTVDVTRVSGLDGYTWIVTFSGCADHIINDVVTSVCNRGSQSLLHVDKTNLNTDSEVSSQVVMTGQGSDQESGYGFYVYTDQDSNESPYSYTITGLDTDTDYFVRVSAHTSCDDTCRKGSSDQLGCCGFSYSQVSEPTFAAPSDQRPGQAEAPILVSSNSDSNGFTADITLSWNHPTVTGNSKITGYELWMDSWNGGNWRRVHDGRDKPDVTTATVSYPLVRKNEKYVFKVRAANAMGYGEFSDSVQFTVRAPSAPGPPAVPTRGEATNCGTVDSNDAEVHIKWKAPVDNGGSPVTDYQLYLDDGLGGSYTGPLYAGTLCFLFCFVLFPQLLTSFTHLRTQEHSNNKSYLWTNHPREHLPSPWEHRQHPRRHSHLMPQTVYLLTQKTWLEKLRPCWNPETIEIVTTSRSSTLHSLRSTSTRSHSSPCLENVPHFNSTLRDRD